MSQCSGFNNDRAAPAFQYVRNPSAGSGVWEPLTTQGYGAPFSSNFIEITSGVATIPTGARSYAVTVESGSAVVNGVRFNSLSSFAGGGYGGSSKLSAPIVVGCSGGRTIVFYEI